jgi:hypothetical protein
MYKKLVTMQQKKTISTNQKQRNMSLSLLQVDLFQIEKTIQTFKYWEMLSG